jgi:hypothetical protein
LPTTGTLIDRLKVDMALRRLYGFSSTHRIPGKHAPRALLLSSLPVVLQLIFWRWHGRRLLPIDRAFYQNPLRMSAKHYGGKMKTSTEKMEKKLKKLRLSALVSLAWQQPLFCIRIMTSPFTKKTITLAATVAR